MKPLHRPAGQVIAEPLQIKPAYSISKVSAQRRSLPKEAVMKMAAFFGMPTLLPVLITGSAQGLEKIILMAKSNSSL